VSAKAHAAPAWQLRAARTRDALGRGIAAVEALPVGRVLLGFVVLQWLTVLATALVVRHASWIYYQGGDQLWLYTSGWLLAHGHLTQTLVGYGLPALYAPIARLAGANLVSAFPAIILFNVLVLLPAAVLSLYGIAARIGGRLFGYWALALWICVPFIGVLYTNQGYHQRYTELTLPQSFGLTAMADMPTMTFTLVSVYFCVRVLFDETPTLVDAVAAGVAAGAAVAVKPATVLFLAGPALALVYRRRFAQTAAVVAGLAPAVVALTVWKARGLGNVPLLSRAAGNGTGLAAAQPLGAVNVGRYLHQLNWPRFLNNLDLLREHFWSGRLIEWLVVAGVIALARRSITAALLVGGWFAAFVIVKGSYVQASIEDASLLRLMMPAFPAFIVLLASLPYLVPGMHKRQAQFAPEPRRLRARTRWTLVAAAIAVTAVIPAAAFAAATTGPGIDVATIGAEVFPIPANIDVGLTASVHQRRVMLTWDAQRLAGGPVFYRVWRGRTGGFSCAARPGGRLCNVTLPEVGVSRVPTFVDRAPPGRWFYRIAVAANWLDDPHYGDPYEVSRAVAATVP
jgi:4-amino-4-deoxy-L-arabinose transferase-like glycosyltransferase